MLAERLREIGAQDKSMGLLSAYIQAAMRRARYEHMEDEDQYFGEIPELEGLYGLDKTIEECRNDLECALEAWIVLSFQLGQELPILDGIGLKLHNEETQV